MNLIKKIQEFQKQRRQIRTAQLYYETLRAGSMLIRFIYEDLKRAEADINRHQRRRFEHELSKEGKFSPEMIEYYSKKIDTILKVVKLQSQRTFFDEIKSYLRPRVKKVMPPTNAVKREIVGGYQPTTQPNQTGTIVPPKGGTGESK